MWKGPTRAFPTCSLGWPLLEWWAEVLPSPRDSDAPLIFTREQAMVLVAWYGLHPVTGEFVYRRGCSRRSKGWGKSPVEGVKVIGELCGEVVFDGWNSDGEPVGRPWGTGGLPPPEVKVAAVSEEQTDNTWGVTYALLTDNDGRAADELRIDAGLTRLHLRDHKGKAMPVTASAGSREGAPDTYAALDETHLWLPTNGGVRLAAVLRRNVAKMAGRSYETTNSFVPGEGSVAEATHKAVEAGRGIFYDAVEAPSSVGGIEVNEDASDDVLRTALRVAYGDSWWTPIDRLVQDIRDPDTRWSDACRFFFNWNVKGEGKAVDPKRWAELADSERKPQPKERIGIGFDGSISGDATVLIGCTADGWSFELGVWERPPGAKTWSVPRLAVHDAVREAFETYDVGLMLCDPPKWPTEIEQWAELYGDEVVLAFDTNKPSRFAPAVDRWLTAIKEGTHTHDGSNTLKRHVEACHLKKIRAQADDDDGRTMYGLVKGFDGRKIDGAIADVLAYQAAKTMPPGRKVQPFAIYD